MYSLSLISLSEEYGSVLTFVNADSEDKLNRLEKFQKNNILPAMMNELLINWDAVDKLNYRVQNVEKSINKSLISEYKKSVIQKQLIKSQKMKDYFEGHPEEKKMIVGSQFCQKLQTMKRNEGSLAFLPDYLKNLKIVKNPIEEVV